MIGQAVGARLDGGSRCPRTLEGRGCGRRSGGSRWPAGRRPASTIPATRTLRSFADVLRVRMTTIAAPREDGVDADALRVDPVFSAAPERSP